MISMEKPYYKAILLVLASDNTPLYKEFRKIYQAYLDINPNIRVFLVYGDQYSFEPQSYDLVYDDVKENYYPGMITKTVRALDHIDRNYNYDFLVRTNISTFWDLDRFEKRIEQLPKTECFTGSLRSCIYRGQQSPQYASGVNLTLSRDMVQLMLENQEEMCSWDLPEDWAMNQIFINMGLNPIHSIPSPIHIMETFTSLDRDQIFKEIAVAKQKNRDHYRIKNTQIKNQRQIIDIGIAQILLKEYYDKTIL
jgi:hypothetical protein